MKNPEKKVFTSKHKVQMKFCRHENIVCRKMPPEKGGLFVRLVKTWQSSDKIVFVFKMSSCPTPRKALFSRGSENVISGD